MHKSNSPLFIPPLFPNKSKTPPNILIKWSFFVKHKKGNTSANDTPSIAKDRKVPLAGLPPPTTLRIPFCGSYTEHHDKQVFVTSESQEQR